MASQQYTISYGPLPAVSFPTSKGMKRYLNDEKAIWQPFLDTLERNTQLKNIPLIRYTTSSASLAAAFDNIVKDWKM